MTTVRADDQIGANLNRSIRRGCLHTDDAAFIFQQVDHFRLRFHFEVWIARAVFADEIQEFPLRHEDEKTAVRRPMRKVHELDEVLANLSSCFTNFLMWP